jgi:hypothetical protein
MPEKLQLTLHASGLKNVAGAFKVGIFIAKPRRRRYAIHNGNCLIPCAFYAI